MSQLILCTPSEFIAKTNDIIHPPFKDGYYSICHSFMQHSKIEREIGNEALANALDLGYTICLMRLKSKSTNSPFGPSLQWINNNYVLIDILISEQLEFINNVYDNVKQPILKARLADLLWIYVNPKNVNYARTAINSYIALSIEEESWHVDIIDCWQRAICLSKQIRDKELTTTIENNLLNYLKLDFPNIPFINYHIAKLIKENYLCSSKYEEIAELLFNKASSYLQTLNNNDYMLPRMYFSLAEQFFKSINKDKQWQCTLEIAHCNELEGDFRINNNVPNQMAANFFYREALKTYRKIPNTYRNSLNINKKITQIRAKITESGTKALAEMVTIKTPGIDLSEHINNVINHVKNKESLEHALLCFTGLSKPEYQELHNRTIELIKEFPLNSIIGTSYMSGYGRIIQNDPPINLSSEEKKDKAAIFNKTIQNFSEIDIQTYVIAEITPALGQILSEFRVTKELLIDLCYHSPIVPEGREYLMASALWYGFEYDFGNAIHLLMPQVEHLVRTLLKNHNIPTTNIDKNGIENENGLTALLKQEETKNILGEDLWFEMKAVFTEQVGANLRNNVAHGLLDDQTSQFTASVYAWWMILRLIVRAPYEIEITNENTVNEAVDN